MAVPRIANRTELSKAISSNDIVVLLYVDFNDSNALNYAMRLARELDERLESIAKVYLASRDLHSKPGKNIVIAMYINGSNVFEQYDVFGVLSLDMTAIRRGIKSILKKRGYKTLF